MDGPVEQFAALKITPVHDGRAAAALLFLSHSVTQPSAVGMLYVA